MEIRRFYVDSSDISDGFVTVGGGEFIHMTKILRHKVGYKIVVNNNSDRLDYFAEIVSIGRDSAKARILNILPNNTGTTADVTLMQALPKGDKVDFIVQKATELGVNKIIFFLSEYTAEKKFNADRLRRVAVEACKQCGRATVPAVELIDKVENLPLSGYDSVVFMNERERSRSVRELDTEAVKRAAVIVGSEGGFSEAECDYFICKGALSVSLGKRILRAETASVAAVALIMYKLHEMDLG